MVRKVWFPRGDRLTRRVKNVPKTKKEHLKPLSDGSADTITDTHTHTPPKAQAHNYLGAATKYEQESHTVTLTVIHTGRRLTHTHHTPGTRSHHHTTTHTHTTLPPSHSNLQSDHSQGRSLTLPMMVLSTELIPLLPPHPVVGNSAAIQKKKC